MEIPFQASQRAILTTKAQIKLVLEENQINLNKMKSRLGSISPSKMSTLPLAVQTLLAADIPRLIRFLEEDHDIYTTLPK
jgi:predicted metal-dependent hydrolase